MSSTLALIFIGVAVLFILGIKFLSSPKTARYGNLLAAAGMVVAFFATIPLMQLHEWNLNCTLMAVGIVIGLVIGAIGAYSVKMTAMPQMVAAFNGLGGGSAALVASLEFLRRSHSLEGVTVSAAVPMLFATLIGSLSFSGSIIAFLKLEGKFERPHTFPGQNLLNGLVLLVILGLGGYLISGQTNSTAFIVMFALALLFGIAMVMPIGGADMPVVISLLNSFTGLAVAGDGFVINNLSMIVAGTLVGSSGTLLTLLMCKAMNRPVTNVLFGAFGSGGGSQARSPAKPSPRSISTRGASPRASESDASACASACASAPSSSMSTARSCNRNSLTAISGEPGYRCRRAADARNRPSSAAKARSSCASCCACVKRAMPADASAVGLDRS
jgi:NAD(P) transhydrogenase subunit beta